MRAHITATGPPMRRLFRGAAAALALCWDGDAAALDTRASGRVTFGSVYRLEAADPNMLNSFNAAAAGLTGLTPGGTNSDDANTNFLRHDAVSTALKVVLDLGASEGNLAALVRIKAWRDFALADRPRDWGNVPNNYAAGQPLGDQGAPVLSRFSGVALSDWYVEDRAALAGMNLFGRLGQQSLGWGQRSSFAGGLEAVDAKDFPALRRAGMVAQETRVPAPTLFGLLGLTPELGLEAFYQTRFRPSAMDMCGTFWSFADYLVDGCDKVFAGAPAASDRARAQSGAYLKRIGAPGGGSREEYGVAVTWKALGTDFGLYHARYTSRTANPGLRKASRAGPPLVAGDPDGKNVAYFTEYAAGIALYSFTFAHRRAKTSVYGELTYRPSQPVQLGPGDVLGAFLSTTSASMLRAEANALAPGAIFHAFDRFRTTQAQLGVQQEWTPRAGIALTGGAEFVSKHVASLPDPALRRYGRADQYGLGPINGACVPTTPAPTRQCSFDGYVTPDAWAYRLRLDARIAELLPGVVGSASAVFTHDVKGWSYDAVINQGRKSVNLALRFEYRQRYLAELVYTPVWGGDYNAQADRDQLALAAGVKF